MGATTITVGPLAAALPNNISTTQTPSSSFTLDGTTVSGGVATLDKPRRVLITATGNESGKIITITGTDASATAISEVFAAPNATSAQSALDYKTVTAISISSAASAAMTAGTSSVASSSWLNLDGTGQAVGLQCTVTGVVNYTVQQSFQDPNDPISPVLDYLVTWLPSLDPAVVAASTTQVSSMPTAPILVKVTINSGAGSVSSVFAQYS